MKRPIPITTLFLDIGGVLLTTDWDHHARKRSGLALPQIDEVLGALEYTRRSAKLCSDSR